MTPSPFGWYDIFQKQIEVKTNNMRENDNMTCHIMLCQASISNYVSPMNFCLTIAQAQL